VDSQFEAVGDSPARASHGGMSRVEVLTGARP
jgi:hypothetical protein